MENLKLNIYDEKGKSIIKTCESTTYDLMFGTVQKLMALLKIEDLANQIELLKVLNDAWEEIRDVLAEVFPDVTADEWKHVKVKELIPIIVAIAKSTIADFMSIPTDPKN